MFNQQTLKANKRLVIIITAVIVSLLLIASAAYYSVQYLQKFAADNQASPAVDELVEPIESGDQGSSEAENSEDQSAADEQTPETENSGEQSAGDEQGSPAAEKWRLREPLWFFLGAGSPSQELHGLLTGKNNTSTFGGSLDYIISRLGEYRNGIESSHTILLFNPAYESVGKLEQWPSEFAHLLPLSPEEIWNKAGSSPFVYLRQDARGWVRGIIIASTPEQFVQGIKLLMADGVSLNETTPYGSTGIAEADPGDKAVQGGKEPRGSQEPPSESQLVHIGSNVKAKSEWFMNSEGVFDHYQIQLPHNTVFNIYVTEDYKLNWGDGFGYEEIPDIVKYLEVVYDFKLKNVVLDAYFVHGESYVEPDNIQAATGIGGNVQRQEMIINGKNMHWYDFRTTIVHEFVHVYHYLWFAEYGDMHVLNTLDGNTSSFWYTQGQAEYLSYHYNYPLNTHNSKLLKLPRTRDEVLQEAKNQNWQGPVVQPGIKDIYSFYQIGSESNYNYGVAYSLTWYLVHMYGMETLNNYALALSNAPEFKYKSYEQMSRQDRDKISIQFFGKTERELMDDWLAFFNYFE